MRDALIGSIVDCLATMNTFKTSRKKNGMRVMKTRYIYLRKEHLENKIEKMF